MRYNSTKRDHVRHWCLVFHRSGWPGLPILILFECMYSLHFPLCIGETDPSFNQLLKPHLRTNYSCEQHSRGHPIDISLYNGLMKSTASCTLEIVPSAPHLYDSINGEGNRSILSEKCSTQSGKWSSRSDSGCLDRKIRSPQSNPAMQQWRTA